jgi:hypothetical protein
MSNSSVTPLPVYGVDPDRTQNTDLVTVVRRRFEGRYPVDPFGADPQLQDLLAPFVTTTVRVEVAHPERLPESGPAVLVSNRGLGVVEPAALAVALRQESGRRLRVIGAPTSRSSATSAQARRGDVVRGGPGGAAAG